LPAESAEPDDDLKNDREMVGKRKEWSEGGML
jgi:hypothetical protein